jgi:hypothetical protein
MWIRNVPKLIIWEFDETQYDTQKCVCGEKVSSYVRKKSFSAKDANLAEKSARSRARNRGAAIKI